MIKPGFTIPASIEVHWNSPPWLSQKVIFLIIPWVPPSPLFIHRVIFNRNLLVPDNNDQYKLVKIFMPFSVSIGDYKHVS